MRKLFLDDVRHPPDNSWTVVRSYKAFCEHLDTMGMPDIVSFDHDLAEEHYEIGRKTGFMEFDYTVCKEPTGLDCARYMVENYGLPQEYRIHSMNPVGRDNIKGLLESFRRHMAESAMEKPPPLETERS